MSLITCPKCGKTFSSYSKCCPKCHLSTEHAVSFYRKSIEVDAQANKEEGSSSGISGFGIVIILAVCVAIVGIMVDKVILQKPMPKAEILEWKMSGYYRSKNRIPVTILFKQKGKRLFDGSYSERGRLKFVDMTGQKNVHSIELQDKRIKLRLQLNESKDAGKGYLYMDSRKFPVYLRVVYRN